MTPEEAVKALDELEGGDNEAMHLYADQVLLDLIKSLGHPEVAEAFNRADERVGLWYA